MHDDETIICFESTTAAIITERALLDGGFGVRVMPLPSGIRAGCGFCLRLPQADAGRAAAFLAERGLGASEGWRKSADGAYRRVALGAGGAESGGRDGEA
jgi:hypothetical protein